MTTSEAIESLERRIDFLAHKVATDTSGRKLHRERQEIGALTLAIRELAAIRDRSHLEGCACTEP